MPFLIYYLCLIGEARTHLKQMIWLKGYGNDEMTFLRWHKIPILVQGHARWSEFCKDFCQRETTMWRSFRSTYSTRDILKALTFQSLVRILKFNHTALKRPQNDVVRTTWKWVKQRIASKHKCTGFTSQLPGYFNKTRNQSFQLH